MRARKPILLTGHRGYIGSVMAPYLVEKGYDVVGLDTGYFRDCTLVPDSMEIPELDKDIRDLVLDDLQSFYAVIHLAALSNDPIGNLDETWTEEINYQGSVRLAELAREADVRRFLFASSCIMYGMSEAEVVDETAPLDPKTIYAASKVNGEEMIRGMAEDHFSPTFLRNGTVYGLSPRMRFDTVLNDLCGTAVTTGKVVLFSDGKPWRPVVHVEDIARSFMAVLEAPTQDIHNEAFNNGVEHLNHRIIELAEIVASNVDGCKVEIRGEAGADQRTYKADFSKFARTFPEFEFKWRAETGAKKLIDDFRKIGLTHEQYTDPRFTRLQWLNHLLESEQLAGSLRWMEES